ncbi:deleted in lung and esophageal cancer protein 1 isoform X2 [Ascaphus truei]|uniref:deleted in lung and esophageal cancer protein 1 isoform X2 n=1 Tax=Ascaphus truei TaxID=8439 RepID=UPI003F592485
MFTDELQQRAVALSSDPAMFRPRPSSNRTQDISHLLTSLFKNLYTGDVIGKDTRASLIRSRGGDNPYHETFVEELQQIRTEHDRRMVEADMVERHIIQARARATAEEEKVLNCLKNEGGDTFQSLGLPPVESYFRWCVDNDLLRKHNLICPEDYITELRPITKAPRRKSEYTVGKETFSFHQHISKSPVDDGCTELPPAEKSGEGLVETSTPNLTVSSTPKAEQQRRKKSSIVHFTGDRRSCKSTPRKKRLWEQGMSTEDRERDRSQLAQLENRHNFLKNPRFFPPNSLHGSRSLIVPTKKKEGLISGRKRVIEENDEYQTVPVFLANPPIVFFPDYEVGQTYESVATTGFVEQAPFGMRPAVFELYPGQETIFEIVFFPTSSETYNQIFTIVCDNCQVKDITVTGFGQVIALELVSVSGGESSPEPGELTDVTAEHLIRFQPANLRSTVQKSLIIRNSTHVELPFYWQIMKPNLQTLLPGESVDLAKIEYNPDTRMVFSMSPVHGVLQPHQDHIFIVTYIPTELMDYHSVAHMVLRAIPEPVSEKKPQRSLSELEPALNDVIVMDIELKGATEPFQILLEPYAIIIPGEIFTGTAMRRPFKMWNNSRSPILYQWENITDCHIIQIEPHAGEIEPSQFCEFEMNFTGGQHGFTIHKVVCHIAHSSEPVLLYVEATFKGPVVSIDVPSLDLDLIKLGNKTFSIFTIENKSPLAAKWSMHESRACLTERKEETSQFSIHPASGELLPLGTAKVSVLFTPLVCQRLQTVLELEVENGEWSHLPVMADVQTPQVCLLSSSLEFTCIYIGVPAQSTVKLFNQGRLPAKFSWGELIGSHAWYCTATITPETGMLGPNEEAELCVELTAHTLDIVSDIALCCTVEDMKEPLVLNMRAKAEGLQVTYSLSAAEENLDQTSSTPGELLLDFGSEVVLQSTVKRELILTNHSGISAPFSLEVAYFKGAPAPEVQDISYSTTNLIKRTARFAMHAANKTQADFRTSVLSDGKGAAFIPQPRAGTLGAFQQISIEVSAYNNMWGEHSDELVCKVGYLKPKIIPMKMTVRGCPIYFQLTGPRPERQTEGPVIRFGTHISGGDTISRCLRINNTSPCDIRIDWEMYNREKYDSKLLDLMVFYGDPFPLKDIDGNEIVGSESDIPESEDSSVNWDNIPSTPGTMSSASPGINYCLEYQEQFEDVNKSEEHSQDEITSPPGNKLISVILRAHEGVASDYPYCITPRQTIVPAGSSNTIHLSFTPLMLSGVINKIQCRGFALGFMSLDKIAQTVPGKVQRRQGYGLEPMRIELQAFVKPALLTVEVEEDEGMVFYSVASDLIPDKAASQILTEFVTTRNLKLRNSTETPLYFRLLLSKPFTLSSIDPNKSVATSHSDREEQGTQMVLQPQQNSLVKVSFCTTLELLTYQNLPADQMLPGVQLLQAESGEKKLQFDQQLVIEYSNKSAQQVPLCAYLTVPVLQLSGEVADFGTCFVGQTRTQEVYLLNKSGSKSYWTALLDERDRHNQQEIFSLSPTRGMLEAHSSPLSANKEALLITFTARTSTEYETTVMIHGMLGEKPLRLQIRGQGSYDEKYEALRNA